MVKYWKHQDSVEGRITRQKDGSYAMDMFGEKYPFPGHPRGSVLYGPLSPLKHQIKNQVFNEAWRMMEEGCSDTEIRAYLDNVAWPAIATFAEVSRYDRVPYEQMNPPVRELYRAMGAIGMDPALKEVVCFILQEDDAYRMRLQWLVKFFPRFRKPSLADFTRALEMEEHAEVVGDMKERQRLFRRVFLFMVRDSEMFAKFLREVSWRKMVLTKADKYFFRAKYFKVDYPEYQY